MKCSKCCGSASVSVCTLHLHVVCHEEESSLSSSLLCMCVYTPSPSAHTRRPCTVYHCCYPTKQCTSSPWDNAACFCAVVLQTVHVGHQLPCAATDVVSGTSQSERRRLFRTVFRSGQMGSPCRRSSRIDVRCILLLPRR